MNRKLVWISALGWAAAMATAAPFPAPTVDAPKAPGKMQTAVLAGGCFWGVEAVFDAIAGVSDAVSGYAGGPANRAQYETVSTGKTGHAESVEITYDPSKITYGQLLKVYFSVAHDPTELNRQGPDTGTQYRSTIFYANDEQKHIAEAYIAQLNQAKVFNAPIVTTLEPLKGFYRAEDYHQDFMKKNPDYPYIVINDAPKVKHLKEQYPELVRGGSK
jgi:peptide-methionine (S)-S-oxide reductase